MAFRREVLTDGRRLRREVPLVSHGRHRVVVPGQGRRSRCAVVPVPVAKHEHRAWAAATEEERVSRSKRNFYRFLDRWRDHWDLVLSGEPEHHDHDHDHHHEHDGPVTMPEGR